MLRDGFSRAVSEPREPSMMAASGTTYHNLKTAALAHSSNNAPARRSRRSRATSMKMHATMPGHSRARRSSSDQNARKKVEMRFAHLKVHML